MSDASVKQFADHPWCAAVARLINATAAHMLCTRVAKTIGAVRMLGQERRVRVPLFEHHAMQCERHREIGVLKAIGARDRDVLRWFELEAVLVGAAGGVLGAALGLAVTAIVGAVVDGYLVAEGLDGIDLGTIPWGLALLGVLGSVALSVLAGTLPALRAARLPARDAVGSL